MSDIETICTKCQMRLPERLTTADMGPRGSEAHYCYVCRPTPGKEAERAEVVGRRRTHWLRDHSPNGGGAVIVS